MGDILRGLVFIVWVLVTGLPAAVCTSVAMIGEIGAEGERDKAEWECRQSKATDFVWLPPWKRDSTYVEPPACWDLDDGDRSEQTRGEGRS